MVVGDTWKSIEKLETLLTRAAIHQNPTVRGGKLAIEGIMTGTLTRRYHNFPATGKSFSVPISVIGELDVDNAKIKRATTYFDLATFLRQVGLPPETPLKQG